MKYLKQNGWKWKNLGLMILSMFGMMLFVGAVWFAIMSFMAWLTIHAWSIIAVGIFGFGREITFWEAFVIYAVLGFIANLFRSKEAK